MHWGRCFCVVFLCSAVGLAACTRSDAPAPISSPGPEVSARAGEIIAGAGDSVFLIAERYGISNRDLIEANGLQPPYALQPGQRIKLVAPRIYTVQLGDSVSGIARSFGVSVTELVRKNKIATPYRLTVGHQLTIPSRYGSYAGQSNNDERAAATVPTPSPSSSPITVTELPATPVSPAAPSVETPAIPAAPSASRSTAPAPEKPATETIPPAMTKNTFLWPVKGDVISGFGAKPGGLYNDGINIAAPMGTAVRAGENGVVAYVGDELKSFGNLVLIRHDKNYVTAYAHLKKALVAKGDVVKRGQTIGQVGKTGLVDRPQLHFEVRKDSAPINPMNYLGK